MNEPFVISDDENSPLYMLATISGKGNRFIKIAGSEGMVTMDRKEAEKVKRALTRWLKGEPL